MQMRAYTIYDNKALVYGPPFYAATDGAALRSFQELVNDVNTSVGRHPQDFSLWWCGAYDDSNGQFKSVLPLTHVADASAVIQQQSQLPIEAAAQ